MDGRFQTTRWSLVLEAAGSSPGADEALESFCRTYWYPLYGFVRGSVRDPDKARDLTQAYFLRLLEKDYLKQIDPSAGRFRAFLLASIKHFLSNERTRERALKRSADNPELALPLDAEARYQRDAPAAPDPERAFDRRWALTLFENAMQRLSGAYTADGKSEVYHVLNGYLTGRGSDTSYDEAARELGMTEGAVKVAVHRMRKRLGRALRDEIAQTVVRSADVDDELRYLLSVMGER